MIRRLLLLIALLLLAPLVAPARAQGPAEGLVIDTTADLGPISPFVFGANYGPWNLASVEMHPEAADSGVTHLRFPAGRWGDENNITEGQLDLFMLQASAWGAAPSVHVRLEGGTPEQAAELVRYANIEKG